MTLPPAELLVDDAIGLRLIRVLGPANAGHRPANAQFLASVSEYRFAVHRRSDGVRVGRIHLRRTRDENIVKSIGHRGYAVDEPYRRSGYATRAVKLIIGVARFWNLLPLWIVVEPDNIASRRTLERAGFSLVDIVNTAPEVAALGVGAEVCRYRIDE